MRLQALTLAIAGLAAQVAAHYTFPGLSVNGGAVSADWAYVRKTTYYESGSPLQNVTTNAIRCNELAYLGQQVGVVNVTAGSNVTFRVSQILGHDGPLMIYMAKAPPSGVATWDGSGKAWFKIHEVGPTKNADGSIKFPWPTMNWTTVPVTIPRSLPNGEYLLRVEHIALHGALEVGGAQFYIGCAQVRVSGGGSGTPSPLVSFPGAYTPTDPGILFQPYWPTPMEYIMPGPTVWKG